MNPERAYQVILAPHVSEKSTMLADASNQVAFKVRVDSSKDEIHKAVEMIFNVQVNSVQVVNVRGKQKKHGKSMGRRKNWKKAYVRLAPGQDIDFTDGQA